MNTPRLKQLDRLDSFYLPQREGRLSYVCFCCSATVSELLSECGLKDVQTFIRQLDTWDVASVGDDGSAQLRSHCVDFLDKYAASHTEVAWEKCN